MPFLWLFHGAISLPHLDGDVGGALRLAGRVLGHQRVDACVLREGLRDEQRGHALREGQLEVRVMFLKGLRWPEINEKNK